MAVLYPDERHFRSHVHMARHGFGKVSTLLQIPVADLLDGLRTTLYPRLAGVANEWNGRMGVDERYPDNHASFLTRTRLVRRAPRRCCCSMSWRFQLPSPGSLW